MRLPRPWDDRWIHWEVPLAGRGHGSPVAWGDLLVVPSGDQEKGVLVVEGFDRHSGRRLWDWSVAVGPIRKHALNSYGASTPALDAERVYVAWGDDQQAYVAALDHRGRLLWRETAGPFRASHGFAMSPVVYRDLLVLALDHQGESRWVAWDKRTGRKRWEIPRQTSLHYAVCVAAGTEGEELIFTSWEYGVTAVEPRTGRLLWERDVFDKGHIESSIGSPVVAGDILVVSAGWLGYGNEVLALRRLAGQAPTTLVGA